MFTHVSLVLTIGILVLYKNQVKVQSCSAHISHPHYYSKKMSSLRTIYLKNTAEIIRESIRVMQLHPNHFHSISVFLFSPFPICLFISHFIIHQFPQIPSSTIHLFDRSLEKNRIFSIPNLFFSKPMMHVIICIPPSITFSLLGRAATIEAVSDSYKGIIIDTRRLCMRSGLAWIKLLHTSFWETLIMLGLYGTVWAVLATTPKRVLISGGGSIGIGYWVVLGFLGVPFCVAFAHLTVVGSMARVLSVVERDCCGLDALLKAKNLMEGRRRTALGMALLSNSGFRLIEWLFEYRMDKGIGLWEGYVLVSMYSLVLVFDSVMNVVFYYSCKA